MFQQLEEGLAIDASGPNEAEDDIAADFTVAGHNQWSSGSCLLQLDVTTFLARLPVALYPSKLLRSELSM